MHGWVAPEYSHLGISQLGFLVDELSPSGVGNNRVLNFTRDDWPRHLHTAVHNKEMYEKDPLSWMVIGLMSINGHGFYEAHQIDKWVTTEEKYFGSDDFAKNGVYSASSTSNTNYIALGKGDIIWGRFDKIAMWKPAVHNSLTKLVFGKRNREGLSD